MGSLSTKQYLTTSDPCQPITLVESWMRGYRAEVLYSVVWSGGMLVLLWRVGCSRNVKGLPFFFYVITILVHHL